MERLLRRDRAVAAIALLAATVLAWASLFRMQSGMGSMEAGGPAMPGMQAWSPVEPLLLFVMWATMMVAMMLPSATPTILLVASVLRRRREHASPAAPTAVFVAGYLLVWIGFSAAAALVLVEKVVPAGLWLGRVAGLTLAGWGLWMLT